eukprot:symbB.v1.2.002104.t1/scaffold114.1/size323002/10
MAVIQPEGQLTWGGAVLPQIQTLSPRIRKVALERFYLPKLIENGYARDPVIGRVIAAADTRPRPPRRLPGLQMLSHPMNQCMVEPFNNPL